MYDSNDQLNYVCIEPDQLFFKYLSENVARMRIMNPDASIVLHKALIGKEVDRAALEGSGGTKHAVLARELLPATNTIFSVTLDNLVPLQPGRVALLKSDVDGFDFDVIDSAVNLIAEHTPLLFFECHFRDSHQKQGYRKTIEMLKRAGYLAWTILDNFGDVVLQTTDIQILFQLLDYVERQNTGISTRTIYYFDVLVGAERHQSLLIEVVSEYLRKEALDCG